MLSKDGGMKDDCILQLIQSEQGVSSRIPLPSSSLLLRCTTELELWLPLTINTDVLTASDTLCLSSAAVPGLLSPRVNFLGSGGAAAIARPTTQPGEEGERQTDPRWLQQRRRLRVRDRG
ncbi:hypothetical protein FQA47_014939 [Oryzias melastigma]|uniref:Uncharacterized protein n=1 Tax=Oryzias melastigma TaxID=30732 RepID=A0A834L1D0_ORYME|nr:hypothetical protein FQA47_014939 [Oryzias melastigma]